jgi:hypothetical protein
VRWWEGGGLLLTAVAYTVWMVRSAGTDPAVAAEAAEIASAADLGALGAVPERGRVRLAGFVALGLMQPHAPPLDEEAPAR